MEKLSRSLQDERNALKEKLKKYEDETTTAPKLVEMTEQANEKSSEQTTSDSTSEEAAKCETETPSQQ